MLPWGFVFGLLSQPLLTFTQTVVMSVWLYSGTAQFVALEQWGPAMSLPSLMLAVLAINARYLLQGASVAPWFSNVPRWQWWSGLFVLTDMSWALSTRRVGQHGIGLGYFFGAGATIYSGWVLSTAMGYLMPMPLAQSRAFGLDFAVTAAIIGVAGASFAGRRSLLPWAVALVSAAIAWHWLPGSGYVLVGGVAGALVGAWRENT